MKIVSRFAFACAALALAAIAPASAESLDVLAGKTHYHGIAFARSGSATLLLASHHGLFALTKNGEATRVSPVHDYMGFSPDPVDPLSYYASGHPSDGGNSGFLKSVDGGASWKQLSPGVGGPVDFHQMDVSPADLKTIYGSYGDLQISRDGGQTWSIAGTPPTGLISLAASGVKADQIYAATKQGLYVSADAGASWQSLEFKGEVVSTVKVGPDGSLFAFVLGRGLMKANESKPDEWTLLSNGFGDAIPLHLAVNPVDHNHLALTTQENGVLESRDGGSTWAIVWKGLMYKYWFAAAALAAAVAIGALLLLTGSYNPFDTSAGKATQIAQGQTLYGVRCASCHGKNLEGQPNWRTPLPNGRMPAPPHDKTGHTWHHTDDALAGVTKLGLKPFAGDNYESDMPAFGTILSDEEIEAILTYIKSTWPEREQAYQRQLTQQAKPQ